MRKKPMYDWDWFESHTPFKSTLEKMCGLEIEHEIHKIPVWMSYTVNHHYKIKYNHALFERDFAAIKAALLNTNICKNNADVYELVNKRECNKRTFSDFVTYGCIGSRKNKSCSFEWDDMSSYQI